MAETFHSFTAHTHVACASAEGESCSYPDGLSDQISRLVAARHVASLKTQLSSQFKETGLKRVLHFFQAAL